MILFYPKMDSMSNYNIPIFLRHPLHLFPDFFAQLQRLQHLHLIGKLHGKIFHAEACTPHRDNIVIPVIFIHAKISVRIPAIPQKSSESVSFINLRLICRICPVVKQHPLNQINRVRELLQESADCLDSSLRRLLHRITVNSR